MKKSILKVVHDSAKGLYDAGLVNAITMHTIDELCLPPVRKLGPREIKKIRLREKLSQAVLARVLNVSLSTVRHWEIGDKHPSGAALKLLNVVAGKGLKAII